MGTRGARSKPTKTQDDDRGGVVAQAGASSAAGARARAGRAPRADSSSDERSDPSVGTLGRAVPSLRLALPPPGPMSASTASGGRDVNPTVVGSANSIAGLRAMESSRDAGARLFADPFAERLAGPDVMARLRARLSNDTASSSSASDARRARGDDGRIAIRTKFFDDAVLEGLERASASASALGGASSSTPRILQVVLLGAGYDTRAWRLHPPEGVARDRVVVYEVDVADVLRRKREILGEATPRAPRRSAARFECVAADLEKEARSTRCDDAGRARAAPRRGSSRDSSITSPRKRPSGR